VKLAVAITITALLLIIVIALPSAHPQIPAAREVVSPSAYVSVEPVARNSNFQLAVVLKIRPGFHINARKPAAEYLIPTDLRPTLPAGFQVLWRNHLPPRRTQNVRLLQNSVKRLPG